MRSLIAITLLLISNIAFAYEQEEPYAADISLIKLLANPEQHHGSLIRAIGAASLEPGKSFICLSKDDLKYAIKNNCIWLNLESKTLNMPQQALEKYNGEYVLIQGLFSINAIGASDVLNGEIEEITLYQLWEAK